MKNVFLAAIFFFVGFAAVLGYRYMHKMAAAVVPVAHVTSPSPTFTLNPPSQSVSATLTIFHNKVSQLTRTADSYQEATNGGQILTGESIATDEKGAAVATVSGIVTTTLGSNTELVFANLFPEDMVLQQKGGKIQYDVTDTGLPVAVRALHTLVSINSGTTIINVIDSDMSITVKTGSLKFALVDNNNNTHVWELSAGHRANIDDPTRSVYFVNLLQ